MQLASIHPPMSGPGRPSFTARYLDAEDPDDLHALLVRYFGDPLLMKLRSVRLPGDETMSFFYARVNADLLLTPTHKFLVVAVLRNDDPAFGPPRRRLSELGHWTSFQTRTFGATDLPLVADAIVGHDLPTIAARDTPLSRIALLREPAQAPADGSALSAPIVYRSAAEGAHPLRVTLVPVSDRVQLASRGTLRDALETFQCTVERV